MKIFTICWLKIPKTPVWKTSHNATIGFCLLFKCDKGDCRRPRGWQPCLYFQVWRSYSNFVIRNKISQSFRTYFPYFVRTVLYQTFHHYNRKINVDATADTTNGTKWWRRLWYSQELDMRTLDYSHGTINNRHWLETTKSCVIGNPHKSIHT